MRRYTGNGREYVLGVPMRDLSDEEWDALTPEQRKAARPLYQREVPLKPKPRHTKAEPPEESGSQKAQEVNDNG